MSRFDPTSFRATSKYGSTPIHPHQTRRMAAHHRKVGSVAYRQLRLTMDLAHSRAALSRLAFDLRAYYASPRTAGTAGPEPGMRLGFPMFVHPESPRFGHVISIGGQSLIWVRDQSGGEWGITASDLEHIDR